MPTTSTKTVALGLVLISMLMWLQMPAVARSSAAAISSAKLTEAHGKVYRRGFQDWDKQLWDDPVPAATGDLLSEGMQVGTGDNSWAELTWTYITTRAWANSVYAIAPNRRLVYLVGGEMLYHLDKNRKDKSPYFVWTNLLQARIRGTTVLFQNDGTSSRITVLEGEVEVTNRKDRSVVALSPGMVYEIKRKPHAQKNEDTASTTNQDFAVTNIALRNVAPQTVFETADTITSISTVDPKVILSHPLITNFETPLASLPLVQTSMNAVSQLLTSTIGDTFLGKALTGIIQIDKVPTTLDYVVGPIVGQVLKLPAASVEYFPPLGVIGQAPQSPGAVGQVLPINGALSNLTQTVTGATTSLTSGLSAGALAPTTSFTAGLTSGLTGSLTGGASTISGVTSGLGGVTSGIGGLTSTVGGITSGLGGAVGTTTSGLGSTLTTTTTGVVNTVTGTTSTVGGAVGGVTGTLGGALGGLFH